MAVRLETDVLVVGGGIAGAFAAYRAREAGARVLLVDRSYFGRSGCSALASGVYPSYMPGDDVDAWMRAFGGPLVNQPLLARSLPVMHEHVMLMDGWGVKWLKQGRKIVRMGAPGRSFANGVWMAEGGPQMMMAVRSGVVGSGVEVVNRVALTELLTSDGRLPTRGRVVGAAGFHTRTGEVHEFAAHATVVCTGPYKFPYPWPGSTLGYMPIDLSGDGIAMMMRAGAELSRLELGGINLNPDHALSAPGLESLMPSGAKWVDRDGRRFLEDYDPKRMEMTSRALLYFAVAHQKERGRVPAMDLRDVPPERMELIRRVIPIVAANQEAVAGDLTETPVPYTYQVAGTSGIFGAGARVNERGETTVPGLYAAGTCTDMTWLPGGHLPFCSVTGDWTGRAAGREPRPENPVPPQADQLRRVADEVLAPLRQRDGAAFDRVHRRLGRLLMEKVGLVLHADRIDAALDELAEIRANDAPRLMARDPHELAKAWGLKQYLQVLEATLRAYRRRTESRVAFIREDYPVIDNVDWVRMVVVKREDGDLKLWDEPLPDSWHDPIPVRPTRNLHLVFRNREPSHAAG